MYLHGTGVLKSVSLETQPSETMLGTAVSPLISGTGGVSTNMEGLIFDISPLPRRGYFAFGSAKVTVLQPDSPSLVAVWSTDIIWLTVGHMASAPEKRWDRQVTVAKMAHVCVMPKAIVRSLTFELVGSTPIVPMIEIADFKVRAYYPEKINDR